MGFLIGPGDADPLNAFVSITFLQGAVIEESPLVKSSYSVMSGISVSWIFLKSARSVTAD